MPRPYHDADWLRERYHGDGATQREIAEECDVSPRAIRKWMKRHDIETRAVEGENRGLYGEGRTEVTKRKIADELEGREFDAGSRKKMAESHRGNHIPEGIKERISASLTGFERPPETRRKMSEARRGEKNPMYKDGESGTYGAGWSVAKRKVRARDQDCQSCGTGGAEALLDVHHIIPIARFRQADGVDLSRAHDLSNLVLLCRSCHMAAEHGELSFESGIEDPLDD